MSDKKYKHAPEVWKKFEIETMRKVTKIELELITDPDMYIFFEKGTKGGYSYISNGDSKGSNKYL